MLKPVLAGLAISSLCLAFAADVSAQGTAKKKQPIKRVQAEEDDPAPPRARPRTRPSTDEDDVDEPALPPRNGGGKQPRPEAQILRIEKLTPELEKILKDWELHTSRFKTMAGEFTRFKYDKTFEVEKRADGKFVYEAPDKGNYQLWGAKLDEGTVSKKIGKDGTPYPVKPDEPERWVCNGKKVIKLDDREKTYEEVEIPPDSQGQNIIDGPLPFLFGMKADKAKLRYKLSLLEHKNPAEIWLQVIPRQQKDAANWVKAKVIIEAKTFQPIAVNLTDATGAESVHVFRKIVVNERRGFFDRDPFKPSLRGYKLVMIDKSAAPAIGEKPIAPATSKQSRAPTGKTRAAANDPSELDLGRTADAATDNPPRKKSAR